MKEYKILLLFFFLLLVSIFKGTSQALIVSDYGGNKGAKSSLSGKVTNEKDKSVLLGAAIYIPDLKLGTVSDVDGGYQFLELPMGTFLVEVSYIGFKPLTREVKIAGDVKEDFIMSENPVEQSEVVVTGLSKATQAKRSPIPILTARHDYLENHLETNIIDGIAKLPGVAQVTTGPNVSKPFIRGLGYNRILTLYDNVRQEGQQWGDEHGIEVDQYGVDRVEVVKGPASLSYGSDALGGVVNLIPTQTAPEGKVIGNVVTEYQSNNGMFGGSAMLGANKNGLEWMGRVSHKEATNYQNRIDGRVFGTRFNETDASASVGLHRDWGYSHLNFSLYDDLQEIPDGSRDSATRQFTKQITDADIYRPIVSSSELSSYGINPIHQHVQHYRVSMTNNFIVGDGQLTLNLGFQRSVRREYSHPEQPEVAGLYLQLNTYAYDMKYAFPQFYHWDILAGVNGMLQENTVTAGTEFVVPSYHQFDVGPFVLVKKSYGKLDVAGGVRYDFRTFGSDALYTMLNPTTGFDVPVGGGVVGAESRFGKEGHDYSGSSGSLGMTYNFSNEFSMKANVSRGYRAPNISEISSNGVHPGTNIYQIGGISFQPEFSFQEDIGFVYSSKYVATTLSVFNNHIDHYIYNEKLLNGAGQDSVIVAGNQTFVFRQGTAHLYGGELSLDIHPIAPLHFENSVSVVYGDNQSAQSLALGDSAKYLPFIPPLHGISELRYNTEIKSAHVSNAFAYAQVEFYAAQDRAYLAYGTETPTAGYVLTNLGLGGTINTAKGKTLLKVSLLANNIFDVAYQSHLSRLKYFEPYPNNATGRSGIYNMGRNFAVKVSIPLVWDWK